MTPSTALEIPTSESMKNYEHSPMDKDTSSSNESDEDSDLETPEGNTTADMIALFLKFMKSESSKSRK